MSLLQVVVVTVLVASPGDNTTLLAKKDFPHSMDVMMMVYLMELLVVVRASTNTHFRGLYGLPSLRTQVTLLYIH